MRGVAEHRYNFSAVVPRARLYEVSGGARVKVIELLERVRAELAGALALYPGSAKSEKKKKG